MSTAYRSPPIQPGVAPDPNYLMRDLDMQFMAMVRKQPEVANWHRRFAWEPSQAFSSLRVDMPIDLSSFGFEDWKGLPTFKKGTNVKIRQEIAPFWAGTYINLKELENPESAELIGFEQRAQQLMSAWDRQLPPKIYAALNAGQGALAEAHPITGASAFFSETHYYNVDHEEYSTFSNLIGDGGANASTPIYAILEGGSFDNMKPWCILKGSNLDKTRAAGGRPAGGNGAPWVIHWEAQTDRELLELNFERRMGIYAERGVGLLFPHSVIRFEGTLDYAGLVSIINNAGDRKDLNGYMQADQTRISALLCHTTAQATTIKGLLEKDITGTANTDVKIAAQLKSAEIIVMSR